MSFGMGLESRFEGFLVDFADLLTGKIVEIIEVFLIFRNSDIGLRFFDMEDGLKENRATLLDELAHRVKIRGEDTGRAKKSFSILTFGFIEELLQPFFNHLELEIIGDKHLGSIVELGIEKITVGAIEISRILLVILDGIFFFAVFDTAEKLLDVGSGTGDRKKTDRSDDRVSATDIIRDDKALVAFLVGFGFQSASCFIGCGIDGILEIAFTEFSDQLFLEETERKSGFGSGTGFGDDVDCVSLTF